MATYSDWKRSGTVDCVECGKVFKAASWNAMYCSGACKMRAYRRRKSDRENLPELCNKPKNQPGRAENRRGVCPHCGKHFSQGKRARTFCKPACRVVSNRMKQAATVRECAALWGKQAIDAFALCERDWKSCYKWLENRGMYYKASARAWYYNLQPELI